MAEFAKINRYPVYVNKFLDGKVDLIGSIIPMVGDYSAQKLSFMYCDTVIPGSKKIVPPDRPWLKQPDTALVQHLIDNSNADSMDLVKTKDSRTKLRLFIYKYIKGDDSDKEAAAVEKTVRGMLCMYAIYRGEVNKHDLHKKTWTWCEEWLKLVAHICEKYRLQNEVYMRYVAWEYTDLAQTASAWFEFLSPLGMMELVEQNFLYPYPADKHPETAHTSWLTEEHLGALEYYLKHASHVKACVLFRIAVAKLEDVLNPRKCGSNFKQSNFGKVIRVKFINLPARLRFQGSMYITPLTWACQQANTTAVTLLIRYGAVPLHPYGAANPPHSNWEQPLFALGNSINSNISGLCSNVKNCDHIGCLMTMRLIECLSIIMQSYPYLPFEFEGNFMNERDLVKCMKKVKYYSKMRLDYRVKAYLPTELTGVSKLQNICRYIIRDSLQQHDDLPNAISQLQVPGILKKYIDLLRH